LYFLVAIVCICAASQHGGGPGPAAAHDYQDMVPFHFFATLGIYTEAFAFFFKKQKFSLSLCRPLSLVRATELAARLARRCF